MLVRCIGRDVNVRAVDPRLDFARELERRDAATAERLELLGRLAREVDRIRGRARDLTAYFQRLPAEQELVASAAAEAEAALERAHAALAEAEAARGRARSDDARAAAKRELAGAHAAVHAAAERLERTAARRAALEQEAEESQAEARTLARAAADAARELEAAPRVTLAAAPGEDLADVLDWAARAQAAILVVRSGLDAERDRIFREANELGSSVLGEALQSTNVSLVRRRVEERLGEMSS
jgi:chromosome segregation ATPase